ncbi:arylamine N-acetyltransferase family protein [Streptomyces sp. NPDC054796]
MWHGEQLDLDAYLARIGYDGERAPTFDALRELHRAHVLALPFENLEIILGRDIPLDLAALQDKLVHRRHGTRGAYCFEHVTLFAAALERFGFGLTGLLGRVRMGSDKVKPETHAMLRVETAGTAETAEGPETGRVWLCDVGFGSSPLTPIELADGAEASADDWRYRLEWRTVTPGARGWMLYAWDAAEGRWFDRHGTTPDPRYPVDYEAANHFVATHPRSPFVTRPFIQRVLPDRLHVLDGLTLTTTRPLDGSREARELAPGEVPEALDGLFGIRLEAEDARRLVAGLS